MTTQRNRSRYANDDLARRAAKLALELGVSLRLGADGSVTILGKLDTQPPAALASAGEKSADGYEAWKRGEAGPAGRQ